MYHCPRHCTVTFCWPEVFVYAQVRRLPLWKIVYCRLFLSQQVVFIFNNLSCSRGTVRFGPAAFCTAGLLVVGPLDNPPTFKKRATRVGYCRWLLQCLQRKQPNVKALARLCISSCTRMCCHVRVICVKPRPALCMLFSPQNDDGGEQSTAIRHRKKSRQLLPPSVSCHRTGGRLLRAWLGGFQVREACSFALKAIGRFGKTNTVLVTGMLTCEYPATAVGLKAPV